MKPLFLSAIVCGLANLAFAGTTTPRMLFVPAGTDPSTTTTGQPFEITVEGGTVVPIEAYVFFGAGAIDGVAARLPCEVRSDQLGAVDTSMVTNSNLIDTQRPDYVFANLVQANVADAGDCSSFSNCSVNADCSSSPANECIEGRCLSTNPSFAAVALFGDTAVSNSPLYFGEFAIFVPSDASGRYLVRPVCCPSDADCDGASDGICIDPATFVSTDQPEATQSLQLDGLAITIQTGTCQNGFDCTPDVTQFQCANEIGGFFTPDAECTNVIPVNSHWVTLFFVVALLVTTGAIRKRALIC